MFRLAVCFNAFVSRLYSSARGFRSVNQVVLFLTQSRGVRNPQGSGTPVGALTRQRFFSGKIHTGTEKPPVCSHQGLNRRGS